MGPSSLGTLSTPAATRPSKQERKTRRESSDILIRSGIVDPGWFDLSYQEQIKAVEMAGAGSVWVNISSGKTVEILTASSYKMTVKLKHGDGSVTCKQTHYFAYDYCPKNPQAGAAGGP